jgi:hypothetical protein
MDEKRLLNTAPKEIYTAIMDYKVAWGLYKANLKTFIGYAIFCMFMAIVLSIVFTMFSIILAARVFEALKIELTFEVIVGIASVMMIPIMLIYFALIGSFYGLCFDIMSSGDEFTEFKSFITYFRRYWKQYILLSIICGCFNLIFSFYIIPSTSESMGWNYNSTDFLIIALVIDVIGMIWYYLFLECFPAVTSHGSVRHALKENFAIIKQNPRRIFGNMIIYMVFFELPIMFIVDFNQFFMPDYSMLEQLAYILIMLIIATIVLCVSTPLLALTATRVYNTSKVDKLPPESKRPIKIERKF